MSRFSISHFPFCPRLTAIKRLPLFLALSALISSSATAQIPGPIDYDTEVQPILTQSCATPACHGRVTSGVLLTDYDAVIASVGWVYNQLAVVPGDAAASPLFDKINQESPMFGDRMPLRGAVLPDAAIETIGRWIDNGALPSKSMSRGDFDRNEAVNISDAVLLLNFLFSGGAAPDCESLVDTNDDGSINLSDAVFLLSFLFASGPAPAPMTAAEQQGCS